jgi:hypothetical protein
MKKYLLSLSILLSILNINAQNLQNSEGSLYPSALTTLRKMLEEQEPISFKKAVFVVENAYLEQPNDEVYWEQQIALLVQMTKAYAKNTKNNYTGKDSLTIKLRGSLFKVMTDTTAIVMGSDTLKHPPFTYDFDDIWGKEDWSKMFITKLLATHKGNCHSMPMLYKVISEALDLPCHLAFAPNHIYIKHYSEKIGWYNTELTSAAFPVDAWIMASGHVSLEAVQNGLYMDTLSDKQMLAICAYDLGKGYERKFPNSDGSFIIECCNVALKHYPNCLSALLLKAKTQKHQLDDMVEKQGKKDIKAILKQTNAKKIYDDMNSNLKKTYALGYRPIPEKTYREWLFGLSTQKDKYENKQMKNISKQ